MISDYTEHVSEAHRKKFGQFFTHPSVARFMVRWVSSSGIGHVFDPAFGLGAFYAQTPDSYKNSFAAMELDPEIIRFWRKSSGDQKVDINQGDYLHTWGIKNKNIVCNPPYMRFQKFLNRDAVLQEFQEHLGVKLSGYTNTASAFLIKSLSELEQGGRLAYIMPLEFLNTGYGTQVKKQLLEKKHLFGIISFDCEKEIFPDATTSVGIILFDRSKKHSSVNFYSFGNLEILDRFSDADPISEVSQNNIDPTKKWLPFFQNNDFEVDSSITMPT